MAWKAAVLSLAASPTGRRVRFGGCRLATGRTQPLNILETIQVREIDALGSHL